MTGKSHLPPVPPASRSPAGQVTPGEGKLPPDQAKKNVESHDRDTEQQGRQGNTWQNTHHQGYQQDR